MEDWKKEYDNIKVPEEMREKLEQSINRAKKEKKRMKKITKKKKKKKKKKNLKKNLGKRGSSTCHRVDSSEYQPDCSGSHAADSVTW